MRLPLAALAALLCCPAAAAAAPFGEVPFQPLRDGRIVKCLEPAGPDHIGFVNVLEDGTEAVALVRVAADGALAVEAVGPLGPTLECPSIAASASGAAVVAHASFGGQDAVVVALREPGGDLGRPLRVPGGRRMFLGDVDAAIASSGAAVVSWLETGFGHPSQTRLRVIRRAAGGGFGTPETLSTRVGPFTEPVVGVDDSGRATVAWARETDVAEVAAASPGAAFGDAQRLRRSDGISSPLALTVADDGYALLAYEGVDGIRAFERAPGAARMTPSPRYATRPGVEREQPVVALAPGGGAAVAWRLFGVDGGSVEVALRPPGGTFQLPRVLNAGLPERLGVDGAGDSAFGPDVVERALQVGVGAGGAVVVAWLEQPTIAGGDAPARVALASGTLTGSWEEATLLGGPGRSADGLAVLGAPGAVLWTDNLPDTSFGFENALSGGRLHRALAGVAPYDPAPPEVVLQGRAQRLRSRDAVVVRARCSAACDLRAVAGADADGGPAGVGAAQLDRAGRARIAVRPRSRDGMVPRGGGPLRVTVHATAPGGARPTVARLDVRARHAFVPPPRRPLDVRVARRGDGLVVTWRTARPARSETFEVSAKRRRRDVATVGYEDRSGRGRTRFRVDLRDAARARWVELTWSSTEPRFEPGRMTVPVPGGER